MGRRPRPDRCGGRKRKLIEVQVKEAIFDDRRGRRVYGWHKGDEHSEGRREELFPTKMDLNPMWIAEKLGEILVEEGCGTAGVKAGLSKSVRPRKQIMRPRLQHGFPISVGCRIIHPPKCLMGRAPMLGWAVTTWSMDGS